jgi:hypothetical protein
MQLKGKLYWMSRKSGTVLCNEREAMMRGNYANNQWTGYAEFPRYDNYLAYAVEIKGKKDNHAVGNLYEIDYVLMGEFLKENALPICYLRHREHHRHGYL